jgi:predicted transcriptional regulator
MNRDLEAVAKAEDRSFSWVVRVAISEYLEQEQRRAKDKKVSRAQ